MHVGCMSSLINTYHTFTSQKKRTLMSAAAESDSNKNTYAHVFAGWNTRRTEFNNAVLNASLSGQTALNAADAERVKANSTGEGPRKQNVDIADFCQSKGIVDTNSSNFVYNFSGENATDIASIGKAMRSNPEDLKPSLCQNKIDVANVNEIDTIV